METTDGGCVRRVAGLVHRRSGSATERPSDASPFKSAIPGKPEAAIVVSIGVDATAQRDATPLSALGGLLPALPTTRRHFSAADVWFGLPLGLMSAGEYALSVRASRGRPAARRDVRFTVRRAAAQ